MNEAIVVVYVITIISFLAKINIPIHRLTSKIIYRAHDIMRLHD